MQTKRNVRVALLLSTALCGAHRQGRAQGVAPSVSPAAGQDGETVLVSGGQQFDLKSRANGQTYRVFVAGPVEAAAGGSYQGAFPEQRTAAGLLLGDFNGDGAVDADEARQFAAFKRVVELGDGGRLETTMDRMLSRFTLSTGQLLAGRNAIRTGKHALTQRRLKADQELVVQLKALMGPETYTRIRIW